MERGLLYQTVKIWPYRPLKSYTFRRRSYLWKKERLRTLYLWVGRESSVFPLWSPSLNKCRTHSRNVCGVLSDLEDWSSVPETPVQSIDSFFYQSNKISLRFDFYTPLFLPIRCGTGNLVNPRNTYLKIGIFISPLNPIQTFPTW